MTEVFRIKHHPIAKAKMDRLYRERRKRGALFGIRHGKATVPFDLIEKIRDEFEHGDKSVKELSRIHNIAIDTINDWVHYRTRMHG